MLARSPTSVITSNFWYPPAPCALTRTEKRTCISKGLGNELWVNYMRIWLSNTEGHDGVGEITTVSVRIKGNILNGRSHFTSSILEDDAGAEE